MFLVFFQGEEEEGDEFVIFQICWMISVLMLEKEHLFHYVNQHDAANAWNERLCSLRGFLLCDLSSNWFFLPMRSFYFVFPDFLCGCRCSFNSPQLDLSSNVCKAFVFISCVFVKWRRDLTLDYSMWWAWNDFPQRIKEKSFMMILLVWCDVLHHQFNHRMKTEINSLHTSF